MEKFRFHSARKQLVIFFSWEYESCTPLQKKISEKIFGIICRQLLCSKIGFLRTSKLLNLKHLFKCYDSAPFSWEKNLSGAISLMLCCFQGTEKNLRGHEIFQFSCSRSKIYSPITLKLQCIQLACHHASLCLYVWRLQLNDTVENTSSNI